VREAIQNSLDARLGLEGEPVRVRIAFHESSDDVQRSWLASAMAYREEAGLPIPQEWQQGIVRWMTVEDFSSTGLVGAVDTRTGDFWNYWLNFGLSNKGKSSRGGRGIGRVTFLIASTMNSVLGWTRRRDDGVELACGMAVLRAGQYGEHFRSTHAYLAAEPQGSVYRLHDSNDFKRGLRDAFRLRSGVDEADDSGLSLVIPYPHEGLSEDGIMASIVEHFGPAVLEGTLEVSVGEEPVDNESLPSIAKHCSDHFSEPPVKADPNRYVSLLREAIATRPADLVLQLQRAFKEEVLTFRDSEEITAVLALLDEDRQVTVDIRFPLQQNGQQTETRVRAVIARTPRTRSSIDMFFRDGMYLPDVVARTPHGFDTILTVDDPPLSDYLNLCEGKAHLSLLETNEVKEKLRDRGYRISEKRLVAGLPEMLRQLFLPDASKPDASILSAFFSVPKTEASKQARRDKTKPESESTDPEPIKKRIQAFEVDEIDEGLRVRGNKEFDDWPTSLQLVLAYADGSRKPKWSRHDFSLDKLNVDATGCSVLSRKGNQLVATDCTAELSIQITGFDVNRELDARLRRVRVKEVATDA